MPSPWIILAVLGALIGSDIGSYFYGSHVEGLKLKAYISQQAAVAEKASADSQAHARQIEQDAATKQASIEAQYQGELHDQQQTYETALRGAANGTLGLRVHVTSCSSGHVPATGATAARTDDAGTAQLSGDTAEFLISESHRADQVALLLNQAEAQLAEDRQVCNGATP